MRLYTRFRDLGMRGRVVMTIHEAVYVETPEAEAVQARTVMKEQIEVTKANGLCSASILGTSRSSDPRNLQQLPQNMTNC
jgi:hypothetical protein